VSRSVQRARKAKQIISDQEPIEDVAKYLRRLGYPDNSASEKIDLASRISRCGRGDRKTIVAIVNLLQDADHHVRNSALDALERLIPLHKAYDFDGRKEVIQALGHMCTDFNSHSREKALRLLVSVSQKSDPDVLAAVMTEVFKESDELPLYARLAAVDAVPQVVKTGEQFAIRPLISELDDENPLVRHTTVASLRKISSRESLEVIQALVSRLSDEDAKVRFIVIEALVELGCKGHTVIIEALCEKLTKRRLISSRLPMLKALVALSEPGHQKTISCLLRMIDDEDTNVRLFASESLGTLALRGHFETYAALMTKLNQSKTQELLRNQEAGGKVMMDDLQKTKIQTMHQKKRWTLSAVDFAEEIHNSGNSSLVTSSAMPSALNSAVSAAATGHEKDSSKVVGDIPAPSLLVEAIREASGEDACVMTIPMSLEGADLQAGETDVQVGGNVHQESSEQDRAEDTGKVPAVTTLPLTPPYIPSVYEEQEGDDEMELGVFDLYVPPLQLPLMFPQTARLASPSERVVGTPERSFKMRSGGQTHRFSGGPLPLSTPSQPSLNISASRRRAWLTPPKSRMHAVWTPQDSMRGRQSVATDNSSSAVATPAAPASPLPPGRTISASSFTAPKFGRTDSAGIRASFVMRAGSSSSAGPRQSRLERRKSSAGRRVSVRVANMEPDSKVRTAVIKSLESVAVPGNLDVLQVVAERLFDPDLQVRRQTVQALTILIVPVVNGPTSEMEEAGDDAGKRISEIMASFRTILLQMIEDRSSKFRAAALDGLKVIAKPGDFTALHLLVNNIHQLNHFEVVQLLKKIATPNTYQVVMDCIFFCLRTHDEKLCEDEKTSQAQLRFYVDFLKSTATHGHRDTLLQLVRLTKEVNISHAAKQACMIAVHALVAKKDRAQVFNCLVGSVAVRDLEIAFREPRKSLGVKSGKGGSD